MEQHESAAVCCSRASAARRGSVTRVKTTQPFHGALRRTRRAALSKRRRRAAALNTMAPRPPPKRSGLDKKRPGLDDMTLLTKPTPQGIRDNLKERLEAECIYTYIGNVLVAANPFTWLQIYSSDDAKRYMRQSRLDVPPHVFAVAEAAFRAMTEEEDSQCVIISGESGAGKTEASKHIQGYFALCSQGNSAEVERVKKVFLESNPLLEAFGNAKTLRNNNSSRSVRKTYYCVRPE